MIYILYDLISRLGGQKEFHTNIRKTYVHLPLALAVVYIFFYTIRVRTTGILSTEYLTRRPPDFYNTSSWKCSQLLTKVKSSSCPSLPLEHVNFIFERKHNMCTFFLYDIFFYNSNHCHIRDNSFHSVRMNGRETNSEGNCTIIPWVTQ